MNHSKWPLNCKRCPCLSQESCLTPSLLGHAHKSFFFLAFIFSLLTIFLLQLLAFHQASFEWKNFRESVNMARNTYHGQAKGGKGKFSSQPFTKILKGFGVYFKLHQPNHAGLGILGKVSSCPTINFEHTPR